MGLRRDVSQSQTRTPFGKVIGDGKKVFIPDSMAEGASNADLIGDVFRAMAEDIGNLWTQQSGIKNQLKRSGTTVSGISDVVLVSGVAPSNKR